MKIKKISLKKIAAAELSEKEMKFVIGGSGTGGCDTSCKGSCSKSEGGIGTCVGDYLQCFCV